MSAWARELLDTVPLPFSLQSAVESDPDKAHLQLQVAPASPAAREGGRERNHGDPNIDITHQSPHPTAIPSPRTISRWTIAGRVGRDPQEETRMPNRQRAEGSSKNSVTCGETECWQANYSKVVLGEETKTEGRHKGSPHGRMEMGGLHVFVLQSTGRLVRLARVSGGLGGEVIVERCSCCSLVVGGLCTCSLGVLLSRALCTSGVMMCIINAGVLMLSQLFKCTLEKSGISKRDRRDQGNPVCNGLQP